MKALRVEKFYAFWGQDLDTTTTPLECGRSWRVKFDVSICFCFSYCLRPRSTHYSQLEYVLTNQIIEHVMKILSRHFCSLLSRMHCPGSFLLLI